MDTIDAAMKLVSIEWDAHKARLFYEDLKDEEMLPLLHGIIADANAVIAWINDVSKVKV